MAIALNTVQPIAPAPGARGVASVAMATIPCLAATAFKPGDILVIDAGTRDATLSASPVAAASTIFGVATTRAFTSNATINKDGNVVTGGGAPGAAYGGDCINVALATADARFAGNIVTGTATDEVGDYVANIRLKLGLIRTDAPSGALMAIEQSSTGVDVVYTLEFTSPQRENTTGVWQYGRNAGVGITNPRVIFMFLYNATVFGTAIA